MPLDLNKLVAKRAKATIDFGDGDLLHVEYYPARITSRMLIEIAAIDHLASMSTDEALAVLESSTEILLTLLASWDMVASDFPNGSVGQRGKLRPVPLDEEHVRPLGTAIQWPIVMGVVRAQAGMTGEAEAATGTTGDAASA